LSVNVELIDEFPLTNARQSVQMKNIIRPEQRQVEVVRATENWRAIVALALSGLVAIVTGAYHLIA
jgi:hypothetical protein